MVGPNFVLDINEVIERGLPPRTVRVQSLPATVLVYEPGPGWQVEGATARQVGIDFALGPDQLLVFTTPSSIEPHLSELIAPPDQLATTTIATLMERDDVADAIAQLLMRDFLVGDPSLVNVSQAVQAVAHQGVIVQL